MKDNNLNKIYCSLDIETTGFDPSKEEILELGFVFFEASPNGLKVKEKWTQVFKPTKEVSPQILALTGITKSEIEAAPTFAEHRDFLQQKLQLAVIVGHNIVFDIKFLEAFGLKLNGGYIDTLDLVQWLLPTHHSYNLENLMHTFGISHKDAHRALADSIATLKLLEKLLGVFGGLPLETKEQVRKLIKPQNFLWADLLNCSVELVDFNLVKQQASKKIKKIKPFQNSDLEFANKTYYNFPLDQNYIDFIAKTAVKQRKLIVVPKVKTVLELYKMGLVEAVEFLPEQLFDQKKFASLLKKKNLDLDTLKFLLKILVWKTTNWQTETILDLNLSFFGGQFKPLITCNRLKASKTVKTLACDMPTFLSLAEHDRYHKHHAIICGLSEFEAAVTSDISTKAGWGYVNFLLKGFYNPEFPPANPKYGEVVVPLLNATDLFFGLVSALLKIEGESFQYVKVNQALENDERWQKISSALSNYISKLQDGNETLQSPDLANFILTLKDFFATQENRVKWIELGDNRCVFSSMPLDISDLVKKSFSKYEQVSLADSLDIDVLPKFFLKRLGLNDFTITQARLFLKLGTKQQGDLFAPVKNFLNREQKINFYFAENLATETEVLRLLKSKNPYPAAILFAGQLQVKEFYEHNYESLKHEVAVFAQSSYGGSNKILRNFSINPKSLMLVTDKFILKNLSGGAALDPVSKLDVKTLIVCRLPFEQFTHPYQEALSSQMSNSFENYSLPRALYNFQSILKFFYGSSLENVYIIDAKLAKPYAQAFKNYPNYIPRAKIIH